VSQRDDARPGDQRRNEPSGGEPRRRLPADEAARLAAKQLTELLGSPPERVIGLERRDGGWRVRLEVVELERVPETTSVLASYEVDVDREGELIAYRRTRRYARAQIEEERR
jgi:Gas vesicle synthesis protein GvpO